LKEIQEAEARNAAQREEMAAAARRAQLLAEQERLSQAQAQAPGLPSTANWASAGSPATPTSTGSVWNNKGQTATTAGGAKKTLAQIQKEEEARKQRLAAAAAAAQTAAVSPPATSTSKRYADLASKAPATAPVAAVSSGAWTTVGAGGKPKPPPAAPSGPRATSGNVPLAASPAKPRAVPVASPRPVAVGSAPPSNANRALEEFTKWAKLSLGKGLNSNINGKFYIYGVIACARANN
jgi:PERQ amino acid-rich with GYF domain-containing protein